MMLKSTWQATIFIHDNNSMQTRNREHSHFVKKKESSALLPQKNPRVNIIFNGDKLVILGGGGNLNKWSTGDFLNCWNYLVSSIVMDAQKYVFIKTHTTLQHKDWTLCKF